MTNYKKRQKYDKAFILKVLQMVEDSDKSVRSIAEELGIHPGII